MNRFKSPFRLLFCIGCIFCREIIEIEHHLIAPGGMLPCIDPVKPVLFWAL